MSTQQASREFDVIVWGATGFTGKLVVEYMARQYGVGRDLRWAIGARSESRLEAVRASLGAEAAGLEMIVADSFDPQSLASLAARTRVVLTTVGPYALYGSDLVAACVAAGTDYCDLSGEVRWVRRMVDTHHDAARASGARIVHCCGFDSVPMDIGVCFLQREAQRRHGEYCKDITLYVKATRGGLSGGTLASMTNTIEAVRHDRSVARVIADPYALNPEGEREGPDERDQRGAAWDAEAAAWTAPFIMAGVNTRVVRRSHALAGYPYGRDFRYRETMLTGRGVAGRLKAAAVTATLGGLVIGMSMTPTRKLLQSLVLPKPGEGPSAEQRENGFFNLMQIGHLADGRSLRTRITGDRDPGYGSTSKMLAECAVCLAKDDLASGGGVLTPATAMGEQLLERLRDNAGLEFEIVD